MSYCVSVSLLVHFASEMEINSTRKCHIAPIYKFLYHCYGKQKTQRLKMYALRFSGVFQSILRYMKMVEDIF